MSVTLEAIKDAQAKIVAMIGEFESLAQPTILGIHAASVIELMPGERYIGSIRSADGSRNHHLILLPGDNDDADWKSQMAWAEANGGELPDRVEGALLFATMPDEFKKEAYWTRETHASYADCAWCQDFVYGYQHSFRKDTKLRARAVRRLPI